MDQIFIEKITTWRQELHNIPELANEEFKTQAFIFKTLQEIGLSPSKIANTGVVVDINFPNRNSKNGKCIAFRADIDALPFELDDSTLHLNYKAYHGCGHDMHTTILLGLAYKLHNCSYSDQLAGCIRLIFQPAEEILLKPSGSALMIQEGVLQNPQIEQIYALHVSPRYQVGEVAYHAGTFMSECFRLKLEIDGKVSHGVSSNASNNPILISAKIVLKLHDYFQQIADNNSVLSFCKINGGISINTLPKKIILEGTLRAFNYDIATELLEKLNLFLSTLGNEFKINNIYLKGYSVYSALINSPQLSDRLLSSLKKAVGTEIRDSGTLLASEDFSEYTKKIPGAMFLLGVSHNTTTASPVHSIEFSGSDDALAIGVRCFEEIAIEELKVKEK